MTTPQDHLEPTISAPNASESEDGSFDLRPPDDAPAAADLPEFIGRYRIDRVLGKGGFGLVYLAYDEQLQRHVAIKVPHVRSVTVPEDFRIWLEEARTVAKLDHPHIVPVHDVGQSPEFPCYIVSKFIDGADLTTTLRRGRFDRNAAVALAATLAEALHFAHKNGVVHRDVKPRNILIDTHGRPHLGDFGMALREAEFGKGPRYVGTPAYMSPEQADGEGHRVDGRSDIFSLGVVLYELLTGRRPFEADSNDELRERISDVEARPLRQIDDGIPRELERICLKCLAKRATERYTTASDLADDLRHFLRSAPAEAAPAVAAPARRPSDAPTDVDSAGPSPASTIRAVRIVPKGLRSFDDHDADFFLELLPGPRDRDGLPNAIRFWKTRIEESDPDHAFPVGLIYGPSGCGKTSLVRAGLLPRLSESVIAVVIEATAHETESRLLRGLQKHFPALSFPSSSLGTSDLKAAMASLRRGHGIPAGKKVLIVLDQFEQWLHAGGERSVGWAVPTIGGHSPPYGLVQALRQCDGSRVQCILMIRDDFWMAATRFMRELEVRISEGENSAAVDLFPTRHAEKVLAAFGRANGDLPADGGVSPQQKEFLKQAVAGLAEDGRVICVRLALFAEMMKGRDWTPPTLKEVGGTTGIGVTFLDETFSAATAPPEHRLHQRAARRVLKALLPVAGTDIKGNMRSSAELLAASGYADRPDEFETLIRILDGETRLITPTDPAGLDPDAESATPPDAAGRYFQLTHDYLVPALRDWLTRKQKETRRGRAQLQLAELAAYWNARPENRRLPAMWEHVGVRLFTRRADRTESQRRMLRRAAVVHGIRAGAVMTVLLVVLAVLQQYLAARKREHDRQRAETLVESVLTAPADAVPYAMENVKPFREHAQPMFRERFEQSDGDPGHRLRAAIALAEFGEVEHEFLVDSVAAASPNECANIVNALRRAEEAALSSLRAAAARASAKQNRQLHARIAIVALHLGDEQPAADDCQLLPDPIRRTIFIDTFRQWHADVKSLLKYRETKDAALASGLCLAIGSAEEIDTRTKQALQPMLADWFQSRPDSGTHSAAEWALRKLGFKLPKIPISSGPSPGRSWFVNRHGHTMAVVQIVPQGGSARRALAVSTTEETIEQFQKFAPPHKLAVQSVPRLPANMVALEDAMEYCNWLSKMDNMPKMEWAYKKRAKGNLGPRSGFENLRGYRLPTRAEWREFCRAGTVTRRYCGSSTDYLARYAWYGGNAEKPQIVGQLLPNAWGLFDTLGNVSELCHSSALVGEIAAETAYHVGASVAQDRSSSAWDYSATVKNRFSFGGFRVVRTLPSTASR